MSAAKGFSSGSADAEAVASAQVGEVFTPLPWAQWLVRRWGIFDRWCAGESICDPTAGQGVFAWALFQEAKDRGVAITPAMLARLCLIEMRPEHLAVFRGKVRETFGMTVPETVTLCLDVITQTPDRCFDILVGNPPWANFADIPSPLKERWKPFFVVEGLVPNPQAVLLGASRTDLAALVLKRTVGCLLRPGGFACFYIPMSLFTGDTAHAGFRDYRAHGIDFCVEEVWEFRGTKVFPGVGTSYGCVHLRHAKPQVFPVAYHREEEGAWRAHWARPWRQATDPWRLVPAEGATPEGDVAETPAWPRPVLEPGQQPRQGVNTCGANDVFIFDAPPPFIPDSYLFPLVASDLWREEAKAPSRWILLPYHRETGKPLSESELRRERELWRYLQLQESRLRGRKGTLIGGAIKRGLWWSLLGVGPYSFAPYKVIWPAYGAREFKPIVVSHVAGQPWQGNQAMHAFLPCPNESNARRWQCVLSHPSIQTMLRQLNGAGQCNWAQPGKIKKILETPPILSC